MLSSCGCGHCRLRTRVHDILSRTNFWHISLLTNHFFDLGPNSKALVPPAEQLGTMDPSVIP